MSDDVYEVPLAGKGLIVLCNTQCHLIVIMLLAKFLCHTLLLQKSELSHFQNAKLAFRRCSYKL